MSNYLEHINKVVNTTAFQRRIEYLKYNYANSIGRIINNKRKVLEIGPGKGELLRLLNDRDITNIDIIDNDKAILEYCSKNYKIKDAILSTSLDINLSLKSKYDLIVLTQVFEHIPKTAYQNWLKSLYSALLPGGEIIITVPNGANPFVGTERYGDLQHENIFTIYSFEELMTFANLKGSSYQIRGFEIPPYSLINLVRILLQKILHGLLILLMIINGGIYQILMTPNIILIIKRGIQDEN